MATAIYPDFLNSDEEYHSALRFWQSMFSQLVSERGEFWRPWRTGAYADGTLFERGNPMFSAVCVESGRAVQIIQWAPETDEVEVSGWLSDLFWDDGDDLLPIAELTVSLSLSRESAQIAEELIRRWVNGEDRAAINRLLNELET